jgi:CheY-like chemotaxis protein
MSGLEMLAKMRSDIAPPLPSVLLCTGFDLTEEEAKKRGALALIRKPISPEILLSFVSRALQGEQVPAHEIMAAREQASQARQRARHAADDLLKQIEAHSTPAAEPFDDRIAAHLQAVSRYLAFGPMAVAFLQNNRLIVRRSADEKVLPRGTDLGAVLPEAERVLETGSSLAVSDLAAPPFLVRGPSSLGWVRFFVGVPVLADDDVPIGVICLLGSQPHNISGEDLFILQVLARRGSLLLQLRGRGLPDSQLPGRYGPAIAVREVFEMMLAAEVRLLERQGGSIELVIADMTDLEAVRGAIARSDSPERMYAGVPAPGRVAIYKRDTGDGAARKLDRVIRDFTGGEPIAMGAVSLSGRTLPSIAGQDLLHLADLALARSIDQPEAPRRVLLEMRAAPLA